NEIPPCNIFEFLETAFRATCGNGHKPVHEKKQLVQGNPDRCEEFDKKSLKVLQGSRKTRDPQDLGLAGSGQKGARGYAEVLKCIALSSTGMRRMVSITCL
ncbi:MAG TPA: hypothetical protein VKB88_23050, partial [Bryobacteraceae bacterium]|nr:hypothetical protein [Bryobacteraceae bacterium]